MEKELAYGILVSRGDSIALMVMPEENYLFVNRKSLTQEETKFYLDSQVRLQGLPEWGFFWLEDQEYQGKITSVSLKRAKDMEGQLQLIREKLRTHGLELVLFDGKRGWIIGRLMRRQIFYDFRLDRWLVLHEELNLLIKDALHPTKKTSKRLLRKKHRKT